jgi:RND family efflux transporter MFP subunit
MNTNINSIRIMQLFAGISLLAITACSSSEKKEAIAVTDTAIVVTVATPSANGQADLNVSGQVEAIQSANISTRVMGYITKLSVKTGDHVTKGQLLVTISNDDILAKRAQADAAISTADVAYKNTQKDLDRFNNLYKQQSATAKEMDNITLANQAAKSQLEQAKQMRNEVTATLNYTKLTAPFAGVIIQKLMDAGSMATPGSPILTIEQSGSYQVSTAVPENVISQVGQGTTAIVTITASNKTIIGTVSQISQSSQFTGGQYLVKVKIPDDQKQGLLSGMYANVSIPVKGVAANPATDGQVLVPLSSIEYKDQLTGLYTIGNNNTALLRWVTLGKVVGNQVEVLSGLAPHEQFIVSAAGRLFNGTVVKIKN